MVDWTQRPWVIMADVREGSIDSSLTDGRPTAVPCLPCRPQWGAGIAALWQYLLAQHSILQQGAPFTATTTPEETSHELVVALQLDALHATTFSGLDRGAYSQAFAAAEAGIAHQTTTLHQ